MYKAALCWIRQSTHLASTSALTRRFPRSQRKASPSIQSGTLVSSACSWWCMHARLPGWKVPSETLPWRASTSQEQGEPWSCNPASASETRGVWAEWPLVDTQTAHRQTRCDMCYPTLLASMPSWGRAFNMLPYEMSIYLSILQYKPFHHLQMPAIKNILL